MASNEDIMRALGRVEGTLSALVEGSRSSRKSLRLRDYPAPKAAIASMIELTSSLIA